MNRSTASTAKKPPSARSPVPVYPFTKVVGQEELKLALLLNVIDRNVGGVLAMGHRGTGKSTAVRALADLLPPIQRVRDCAFNCDPKDTLNLCDACAAALLSKGKLGAERIDVPVVELPLGATEDRVCGTINIERALREGVHAFEPGLLARANRGFLYIDEVNLLEDHLVDLLLDVAVTGRHVVERESISVEHPSRFVLVGSGNPEEGELRPQLLDRFGLYVEIRTVDDLDQRVMIVERREHFERDPQQFRAEAEEEQERLRRRLIAARKAVASVKLSRTMLRRISELCLQLKVDGHRGELTIARAARALAAFERRGEVSDSDVRRVAAMALAHRLRRDPLEQLTGSSRIEDALDQLFPAQQPETEPARNRTDMDQADDEPQSAGSASKSRAGNKSGAGGGHGGGSGNGQDNSAAHTASAPQQDARLPDGSLDQRSLTGGQKPKAQAVSSGRSINKGRSTYNSVRGRYARAAIASQPGSKIALDATLRAAVLQTVKARRWESVESRKTFRTMLGQPSPVLIDSSALRYKRFKRKAGTLFIFAIDTSGSMALNRIGQAKGALSRLLQQSYVQRDHVALVSFRGRTAEVLLSPSKSVARARRMLDALPVGGATPLSAGVRSSVEIAKRAAQEGTQSVVLLIFTDGRGNVPLGRNESFDRGLRQQLIEQELDALGAALKTTSVTTIVVDTQNRFVSNGEAERLAHKLGGRCVALSSGTINIETQYSELARAVQ
jgi:magnesium chelatase ATPase subunit D